MTIIDPGTNEPHARVDKPRGAVTDTLELQVISVHCARCGSQVEIKVPHAWRSKAPTRGHRIYTFPSELTAFTSVYGDPALCLHCRVEGASEEERLSMLQEHQQVRESATDAGIPDGATIWPIYFCADDLVEPKAWRGFEGRFLAIQVSGLPASLDAWPGLTSMRWFFAGDKHPSEFLIYETLIWRERIAATLFFISNPAREDVSLEIRNWQRVERLKDLRDLMQGVEAYKAFRGHGGRPFGTTDWTKEQFLEELPRARATFFERHGRYPVDTELAIEMGLSKPTFSRYKQRFSPTPNN